MSSPEERLKTDVGSNADFRRSRTKGIVSLSHVNVWIIDLSFFPTWLPLFWARACLLYMHESSLLAYLHIPSVFPISVLVTVTVNCDSGRNIDFTLKNHCPTRPLFNFFSEAVRFDWIKIDVWLKLVLLNHWSRLTLSLGSAHVKYGVWPGPKTVLQRTAKKYTKT